MIEMETKDAVAEEIKRMLEVEMNEKFNRLMDGYKSEVPDPKEIAKKLWKGTSTKRTTITDDQKAAFVVYVAEHPGCQRKDAKAALNLSDNAYDALFAWGKKSGKLRTEGEKSKTTLFTVVEQAA